MDHNRTRLLRLSRILQFESGQMGQDASLWTILFDIITMDLESIERTRDLADVN